VVAANKVGRFPKWAVMMAAVAAVGALAAGVVVRMRATPEPPAETPWVPPDQQVAVPAYIPPDFHPDEWTRLIAADPAKVSLVVANVASGPGDAISPAWRDVMTRARSSGKRVLGYVDTGYLGLTGQADRAGSTDAASWSRQVEQDVDAWYSLYPGLIDGIFFDRGATDCGANNGNAELYERANQRQKERHAGSMTVLNPGTAVPQCFEDAADILVTCESSYEGYMAHAEEPGVQNYHDPGWHPRDPRKFWHIVHGVPAGQAEQVLARSRERGAGYVYVTDKELPNPYETLPGAPMWSTEVSTVSGVEPTTPVATAAG